jgi:hypothetical protein
MTIIGHLQISKDKYAILFFGGPLLMYKHRIMHHHCINDTKSDQEIVLHELAMIGKWFPTAYVPSQIDVYTYLNGDVEISFFNMTT